METSNMSDENPDDGSDPSCVSLRSDWSMDRPIDYSKSPECPETENCEDQPAPSSESLMSDSSMDRPIDYRNRTSENPDDGSDPSSVSLRSDWSMDRPIDYSDRTGMEKEITRMKEDFQKELGEARSKQREAEEELRSFKQRMAKSMSLLQSDDTEKMTSPVNKSRLEEMYQRLRVNEWPKITDQLRDEGEDPDKIHKMIKTVFQKAADNVNAVKKSSCNIFTENMFENEIPQKVQEHLNASMESLQLTIYHNKQAVTPRVKAPEHCQELVSECYWLGCLMALNIPPLKLDWTMSQQRIDEWDILPRHILHILQDSTESVCCNELKLHLLQKYNQVFEGVAKSSNPTPLQQIYTELYITEGGISEIKQEHEVRHIETTSKKSADTAISIKDIFKPQPESGESIRTVLTVGVAGVGKTMMTQKFSLDWSEGNTNQDIQLLLPFTFRELNLLRDTEYSLAGLLHHFFSQIKELNIFDHLKVVFIFDGLDECRLPLDFSRTRVLTEPTESTTMEVLLVSLIKGSLLPSARLWITTRPAAANVIPEVCVSRMTEVRGFTDTQKEEYFRKRLGDEQQATSIISHIKSIRSLYIMGSIPIFCWILSTVLKDLLTSSGTDQLPQTLTQMYIHFLVVQAKIKNIKYHEGSGSDFHWTQETKEMVDSLGKLAYEQLKKGNIIFYESDVKECGLDAAEIARYSGVFTQVFREESGLYQDKVYCFIHLSVQEFLAALHVHQTFFKSHKNLLSEKHRFRRYEPDFYCCAVDQALQSSNGHLDLFLRFLLGLSLTSNQSLLPGLLTHSGSGRTHYEIVKIIKKKLNDKGVSTDRRLNLLHCLNELNDRSLMDEIQKVMREGSLPNKRMSPADWSALSFLLLSSDSDLEEFDLKKYCPSDEALKSLMPVVKASNKATLSCCNLSEESCDLLNTVLSSSSLTHLDLSNNDLKDSGIELLCKGLKSAACRVQILRLSGCLVSEMGGASLATALRSALSHLKELDLRYNYTGASTERLMALKDQNHSRLDCLRMEPAGEKWLIPGLKKYFCDLSLDPNTANSRLKLSDNNRTVTFMEEEQLYPYHQHRFNSSPQVLCSNPLADRSYWEVILKMDLRKNESVCIALSYFGITSKEHGKICEFGANKDSWALKISRESYSVINEGEEVKLPYTPHYRTSYLSRFDSNIHAQVAVYLDFTGGSLSFYEISPSRRTLLHTYHTSFTQPLFAGFKVHRGSVSLVEND